MTRISEAVECLESLGYTVTSPAVVADEFNRGKQNVDNTFALLGEALTPKPDPRADLVDLFEARAETHDDKSWIEVEEAADVVLDNDWQQVKWSTLTAIDAIVADLELQPVTDGPQVQRQIARLRGVLNSALSGARS